MISKFFDHGHTIPWRPYLSEALQQYAERIGDVTQAKDYTTYAIILQQVYFWTDPYREYKNQYRPEYARRPGDIARYWIYRTWADWHRDIFSLSYSALRRAFYRLRDWGFLLNVQLDDPNWQGQFWAVNHERLDELFAETKLPSAYKDGKRMPDVVLDSVFENVDRDWDTHATSDRFYQIDDSDDEIEDLEDKNEAEENPCAPRAGGGARHAQGGVRATRRGACAPRAGGTSIIRDHFIEVKRDHDHEDAEASVSDVSDLIISIPEQVDLSDEQVDTNKAMLIDEHFNLNWSRTTEKLARSYTPEQLCAVLIRATDNYRAGRIQNLPGWIIKVLKSPESDILELWDEDTNHWIYKKHILKQEPNAMVSEESPLVPPPPPLTNGNGYISAPAEKPVNEAEKMWVDLLRDLALQMPVSTYETWVKDTTGLSYADGQFIIGVPNAYARDWLSNRLRSNINRVLNRLASRTVEIVFQVRDR